MLDSTRCSMLIAITRPVSRSIVRCELTHLSRTPIDLELARRQHRQYELALEGLGVQVNSLPEEPELPDAVFVEDAALVFDECAVITRPGAASRRPETVSVAAALAPYRTLFTIQPPATLDGGDVLTLGKDVYVGLASRSTPAAAEQLQAYQGPFGYRVHGVPVSGCLHLKSAVSQVGENTLLINPAWADRAHFPAMRFIEVDPSEPYAANALLVNGSLLYPSTYPKTLTRLRAGGIAPILLDNSELVKAEGALTCCSLIFEETK